MLRSRPLPLLALCTLLVAGLGAPAVAQGSPSAPAVELLGELPVQFKSLDTRQQHFLGALETSGNVLETRLVQLKAAPIGVDGPSSLTLFPGETVTFETLKVEERGLADYSWFGTVPGTDHYAILVIDGADVTGSVVTDGGTYGLRPLGGGVTAVVRLDSSRLPAEEHPPEAYAAIEAAIDAQVRDHVQTKRALDPTSGVSEKATCGTVDVVVGYTNTAANQVGNMPSLIQLAVDETNLSYSNSGVGHSIYYIGYYNTNYWDSGNMALDRDRWRINGDGYMDEIHGIRNTYDGDVAVLVTGTGSYCGIASAIYASSSTAFAVVAQSCATGYYSFGHEIGHLYGARHNTQADPTNSPYAYGHGYYNTSGNWRTVMSYNCPGGCTRLPYWSNPGVTYGGAPMGTSSTNDNARVLDNSCSRLAGFK